MPRTVVQTNTKVFPVAKRIKRLRVEQSPLSNPKKVLPADATRMQDILKSISKIDEQMTEISDTRAALTAEMFALMKTYKLPKVQNGTYEAETFRPMGRSTSVIDPVAFHEQVSDDDFYESINVVKAKAEKLISGRVLQEITDKTPGKLGDLTISIGRRKT